MSLLKISFFKLLLSWYINLNQAALDVVVSISIPITAMKMSPLYHLIEITFKLGE
jgi:hypothetical protein